MTQLPNSEMTPAETETAREPAPKVLSPEAQRALAEAEERRKARMAEEAKARPAEYGGPQGPEPVRYGDWEKGGIAWDF